MSRVKALGQNARIGCFRGEQGESPRAKCKDRMFQG